MATDPQVREFIEQRRELKMEFNGHDAAGKLLKTSLKAFVQMMNLTLREFPAGGRWFSDSLAFVPDQNLGPLVRSAVARLADTDTEGSVGAARSVVNHVALRKPALLRGHHEALWQREPDEDMNESMAFAAWRSADDREIRRLQRVCGDRQEHPQNRRQALQALLQTRNDKALAWVAHPSRQKLLKTCGGFQSVGLALNGKVPEPLFGNKTFHVVFPEQYRAGMQFFPNRGLPDHPTWELQGKSTSAQFGGLAEGACRDCDTPLHHLLTLETVPKGLVAAGIKRLTLPFCPNCRSGRFQHHVDGSFEHIRARRRPAKGEYSPLKKMRVLLTETKPAWQWQDWETSGRQQSLHRVGGHPTWLREPDYPDCALCGVTMKFLLQFNSYLPTEDGALWRDRLWMGGWGNGDGVQFVCWCQGCLVSDAWYQCF